jgi:hypothetical protein
MSAYVQEYALALKEIGPDITPTQITNAIDELMGIWENLNMDPLTVEVELDPITDDEAAAWVASVENSAGMEGVGRKLSEYAKNALAGKMGEAEVVPLEVSPFVPETFRIESELGATDTTGIPLKMKPEFDMTDFGGEAAASAGEAVSGESFSIPIGPDTSTFIDELESWETSVLTPFIEQPREIIISGNSDDAVSALQDVIDRMADIRDKTVTLTIDVKRNDPDDPDGGTV